MRLINKLSTLSVQKLNTPGMYSDGAGLWLQVKSSSAKSWIFRFNIDQRRRHMGLGSVVTLPQKKKYKPLVCFTNTKHQPVKNKKDKRYLLYCQLMKPQNLHALCEIEKNSFRRKGICSQQQINRKKKGTKNENRENNEFKPYRACPQRSVCFKNMGRRKAHRL